MSEWWKIADGRIGLEASLWIVTWAAVAMLAFIAANLHSRLRRLEAASVSGRKQSAYRHVIGRRVPLDDLESQRVPQFYLLLSANCSSCRTVAKQLDRISWRLPTAVAWTDASSQEARPRLPPEVRVVRNGAALAEQLQVRVTPFALYVGADGQIERAFPLSSIDPLVAIANEGAGLEGTSAAQAGSGGH